MPHVLPGPYREVFEAISSAPARAQAVLETCRPLMEYIGATSLAVTSSAPSGTCDGSLLVGAIMPVAGIVEFIGREAQLIDPVCRRAATTPHPFRWSDAIDARYAGEEIRSYLARRREAGETDGLTIPIHAPGSSGAVTFATTRQTIDLPDLASLTIVSELLYARLVRIGSRRGSFAPLPVLSPRQVQALHWGATGLNSDQIADALSMTKRTVDFHFQAAKSALGTANRTQTITRAFRFNYFGSTAPGLDLPPSPEPETSPVDLALSPIPGGTRLCVRLPSESLLREADALLASLALDKDPVMAWGQTFLSITQCRTMEGVTTVHDLAGSLLQEPANRPAPSKAICLDISAADPEHISAGQKVIIDAVVRHAAAQYGWLTKQMRIRPRVGEFTASEIDILRWAAMGKTNPEIAEILGMTDRNVNTVLIRLTERLSALNKGHTVIKAIELGLFSYA